MAININNLSNSNQIKQQNVDVKTQVKEQAVQNANTAENAKLASKDSVSLTPQAKQLTELQKKAQSGPAVDAKKVAELKKAIESGEYKINPDKLAASIAKYELDLI